MISKQTNLAILSTNIQKEKDKYTDYILLFENLLGKAHEAENEVIQKGG